MTMAVIFLRFYLKRQNSKKDQMLADSGISDVDADPDLAHAFEDRTDQENLNFRYVY